jgi:hypothetical protein
LQLPQLAGLLLSLWRSLLLRLCLHHLPLPPVACVASRCESEAHQEQEAERGGKKRKRFSTFIVVLINRLSQMACHLFVSRNSLMP